ncbi:hypothetical protein QQS21_012211 [Conoideocrella luteorostrata]|uniref:Gfd2/YDR514C-like C-terminal domain-containing protein n=1 Tax=Conoideocrella luteorostrata TaxID=1105319 RepID=A0AAJ0CEF7_9HYPO|nr:hypothetical protein QQS21_012211 [Conoideocrella luteorostrata]
MKYSICPQGFKVGHWRRLYDACISNLEALKLVASNATFVVFDAEPWGGDNTQASELGISILRMAKTRQTDVMPVTLQDFVDIQAIETHWIQIAEMTRPKKSEPHRFGQHHVVTSLDVEQYARSLIDSYRQKYCPLTTEHLIFVGFDVRFELQLLSTTYHSFTDYFTSWLDLQELARLSSHTDKPGLSETLKACGFGSLEPKDLHSLNGRHNAATDTVRAAAILCYLLTNSDKSQLLKIATSSRNTSVLNRRRRGLPANAPEERKVWLGTRPKPRELYPYTARVRHSTGDVLTPTGLLETFAEYEPVAVGTAKRNRYGWVCLPSLSRLNDFIRRVDGSHHEPQGPWIVVTDYDPDITPAKDMRELKERLHARADEKREERRLKRLGNV